MSIEHFIKKDPGSVFRYLMELSGISLVYLDGGLEVVDCNRGFMELLGLEGKPEGVDLGKYLDGMAMPGPGEFSSGQISVSNGSGNPVRLRAYMTAHPGGYLLFAEHAAGGPDDAESLRAELDRIRNSDPLTGLTNMAFFMDETRRALSLARRGGLPLSLIICDLDNFKFITDTYGREVADRVLVSIARIIDDNTRDEDTPARFRGDEFSLLLPNTPSEHALRCAERMWDNVKDLSIDGVNAKLSASFGVAELTGEDTVETLIERAQSAVFKAKSAYPKNVVVV